MYFYHRPLDILEDVSFLKNNKGVDLKFLILMGTGFIFTYAYWYCKCAYNDGNLGIIRFINGENKITAYGFPVRYMAAWSLFCAVLVVGLAILGSKGALANKLKGCSAIAVIVFYIIMAVRVFGFYREEKDIADVRDLLRETRYITHAGGYIETADGRTVAYTNSLESLNNCYEAGSRLMEFDFKYTSDKAIVCAHTGTGDYEGMWAYGSTQTEKPTAEEFANLKLYGSLTTMTLDNIADFMREHKDVWLITDVKNKNKNKSVCKYIDENYPDLKDRIIVQIFTPKEYKKVKNLGFKYMIFILYKYSIKDFDYQLVEDTVKTRDLVGISYSTERADMEEFYGHMSSLNVPMYVHTVNDKESMKKYLGMGFDAMYTDVVDSNELY